MSAPARRETHPAGTLSRSELRSALRPLQEARSVLRSFRELTARRTDRDRRTLIACSGGADSSALAIALASSGAPLILAHVLHDLRPPKQALADRDGARALADRLALPFAEAAVHVVAEPGNAEANARRARYAALAQLAEQHACPFVATGHQADDQAETLLMRLLRGAGPQGLAGIRPARSLAAGTLLIRPMLGITRSGSERICRAIDWAWREDATNRDVTRFRAAIRAGVLPAIREVVPDAAERLARAALGQADAADVLRSAANRLFTGAQQREGTLSWDRTVLLREPDGAIGAMLVAGLERMGVPKDRIRAARIREVIQAVRTGSDAPRVFEFTRAHIRTNAHFVEISPLRGPVV